MLDGLHFEEILAAAVFTGARVSGLMVFCPFLGSSAVPIPVKAVVDGDLCEQFSRLPAQKQSAIAAELDRTVGEVLKKLEQLRVTASGF